jgi:cell division protein FtsB
MAVLAAVSLWSRSPAAAREPECPMARRRRPSRSQLALRWVALAVLLAIAVAYVQPLRAYRDAKADVERRQAEVRTLEREGDALAARLAVARTDEFAEREARKLGLVRPGERLFIVTGLPDRPGLR